jgi:4-amino-4-deoxy-L-arabinose transferase-like glycosyltransferase
MQLSAGKDPFVSGFYQPPGYPLFLSALQSVFGTSMWAPRALQLALGCLTTWLLIRLGRQLGGKERPFAGVAAGLMFALYPSVLMFELDLLTPALTIAVLVLILWCCRADSGWFRVGLAAALAGLASAVHPSFMVLGVVVVVWAAWTFRPRGPAVMAALLGLGLGLAPLAGENLERFDTVQVTSMNAGINFYMGNGRDWKRTSFLRPGLQFRQMALEAEPARRDGFERNAYWKSRAFSDIAAAPHRWLLALGTKAVWSVSDTEIPRNEDMRCRTRKGPLAWLGFRLVRYGLVFPLAFLGALVVWRRRPEGYFVVLAWMALHLPVVLFIVADRYRVVTWPMMCLLAPLGVGEARRWFSVGWARRVGLLGLVALPWLPLDSATDMDPAWCAHIDGNLAFMDGDTGAAEALYVEAVRLDPGDWSARRWLAASLAKRGAYREAIVHTQQILDGFPDSFPTLKTMASYQERTGDIAAAADFMLRAYAVPGRRTSTGMSALRLLERSGQRERMAELLAQDDVLAARWAR